MSMEIKPISPSGIKHKPFNPSKFDDHPSDVGAPEPTKRLFKKR